MSESEEDELTILQRILVSGLLANIILALLFLVEIYPLVLFIRKRKNLNNLTRKDKISLAKIIISGIGAAITIISVIITALTLQATTPSPLGLFPLYLSVTLIFAISITAIVKLVETRNDPNDTDKIITYIQAIGYPIVGAGVFLLFIFGNEIVGIETKKKSKDRRSKLKQLLGSKK